MARADRFEGRSPAEWVTDIEILIGSGETDRAEAVLAHLCAIELEGARKLSLQPAPWYFDKLAALLNGRGDRHGAIAILERYIRLAENPGYLADELDRLRGDDPRPFRWSGDQLAIDDERFRTGNGTFYRPLPMAAAGNVRFVFVGGPMHYVDRRGDHACVSGSDISGAEDERTAEEVGRIASMTDSDLWIDAAVRVIDRVLRTALRTGESDPWCLSVSFVTGVLRDSVRDIMGRPPAKVKDGPPKLQKPARGRWLYFRRPTLFVFDWTGASAGGGVKSSRLFEIQDPPTIAAWIWPDRSDLVLHAFCHTLTLAGSRALTLVLPDTPALRHFARRYNRRESMNHVQRTLLENQLYFSLSPPSQRGTVCYGRFRPTLVIDIDGQEVDGDLLSVSLDYLEKNYELQISPWDLLHDPLMREVVSADLQNLVAQRAHTKDWTTDELEKLERMREWYGRYRAGQGIENDLLYRTHVPKPLIPLLRER
jgi:hypothetical protein